MDFIDQWLLEIKESTNEILESFDFEESFDNILSGLNLVSEAQNNNTPPQVRIQNYLNKVTNSTQKVWNNWKDKCGTKEEREFLFNIAQPVRKFDSSFRINNCPTINMVNLQTVKIVKFDYNQMKDDLHQKKPEFIRKYYPKLYGDQNVYKKLRTMTIPGYSRVICDKKFLITTYNFCSRGFYKLRGSIEDDLNTFNQSIQSIQDMVNNTQSGETPVNSVTNNQNPVKKESVNLSEEYLSEAIPRPFDPNKKQKMTFTDKDGQTTNPNQKIKDNSKIIVRDISRYISLAAEILSAKMRVLNEVYRNRYQILTHFDEMTKKKPLLNNKPQKGQEVSTNKIKI